MTTPSPHTRPPYDFVQGTFLPFSLKNKLFIRIVGWQTLINTALSLFAILLCLPMISKFPEFIEAMENVDADYGAGIVMSMMGFYFKLAAIMLLISIPMFLVSSSALSAMFKQYLTNEDVRGFPLKFDGDMWRVALTRIVVGLIVFGVIILGYFAIAIVVVILIGAAGLSDSGVLAGIFGLLGGLGAIAALCFFIYGLVRVKPIVATSYLKKRIAVGEGWASSKGYFWWILLSVIVVFFISYIVQQILIYGSMGVIFTGSIGELSKFEGANEEEAMALVKSLLTSPLVVIGGSIALFLLTLLGSVATLCYAASGAHVTKLKQGGGPDISDVFAD
ncbi:MAG: hypothetical protein V3U82_00635 [Robiginitomaculum sp.]